LNYVSHDFYKHKDTPDYKAAGFFTKELCRILLTAFYFCRTFTEHHKRTNMENIQNTRGKGYCILYLIMFLFFLTSLLLMLYFRSSVLDFAK